MNKKQTPAPTAPHDEPPRVGPALAALRHARGLTLDELARQSGVSKSMLSQIEREQANPTVAVVWRLGSALGVSTAELLGAGAAAPLPAALTTLAAHATPALRTPDGLGELRILGPLELAGQFEWYQLTMQPGAQLVSEAHERGAREHLSVTSGAFEVQVGASKHLVKAGDTARYSADVPHAIRQHGRSAAVGLLVVAQAGALT